MPPANDIGRNLKGDHPGRLPLSGPAFARDFAKRTVASQTGAVSTARGYDSGMGRPNARVGPFPVSKHLMGHWLLVSALVLAAVLPATGSPQQPDSCRCRRELPPCQPYWESAAVFVGTVRQIVASDGVAPGDRQRVSFDIEQAERGVSTPTIEIEQSSPRSCGFPFQAGQRYVVYAYGDPDGPLEVGVCSRTRLAAEAQDDLAYFSEMKGPASGGRIFGAVRHEEPDFVAHGTRDLGPLAGLPIRLQGSGTERETVTAKDGTFDFGGLTPGRYALTLQEPKGMLIDPHLFGVYAHIASNSFGVELRYSRGCFPIDFGLRQSGGGIRGVLVDHQGAAAEGEPVQILASVNAAKSDGVPMRTEWTGSGGRFEFTGLPAGEYIIGTHLDDRREWTELDRRSYHPGVRAPSQAATITVKSGAISDAGTFRLPADPVERTITGIVLWNDGTPAARARLVVHGAAEEPVPVDGEGRFRLTLPYGAHFTLRASGERAVNGRVRTSSTESTEIGRNHLGGEVRLVLRVPE
jgi:hypothetical protein